MVVCGLALCGLMMLCISVVPLYYVLPSYSVVPLYYVLSLYPVVLLYFSPSVTSSSELITASTVIGDVTSDDGK